VENKNIKCEVPALVNSLSTSKLVGQYQNMPLISEIPYFPIDNARIIYTKTFSKWKKMTVCVMQ
jgi:hypothetical protein